MLCIHLRNNNPFFCLAAEEYLLKQFNEDIFMLWQSENTVVIGKHQNLPAEINYSFVRENNIKLSRRISGGGTVFHDSGNVNFSFIKNVESTSEISFKQFTAPVVTALAELGVQATTSGRNDLLINGFKVSGNAEHVFKKRVLHHGTLLYNSDLQNLGQAIKVVPGKYESKAVQSNRSPVANISSFLQTKIQIEDFIQFLFDVQLKREGTSFYELTENDIQNIQQLSGEKFETWDWIWGYSPKYAFKNEVEISGNTFLVEMSVVKGIISEIKVGGDYFPEKINRQLSGFLPGKRHCFEDVQQVLKEFLNEVPDKLVYVFF